MTVTGLVSARSEGQLSVVLCRSCPQIVLVKSDANDGSGQMQMEGQVCADHPVSIPVTSGAPDSTRFVFANDPRKLPIGRQNFSNLLHYRWSGSRVMGDEIAHLGA